MTRSKEEALKNADSENNVRLKIKFAEDDDEESDKRMASLRLEDEEESVEVF